MSREMPIRIWQASRYNPQHQNVDIDRIFKTIQYLPKKPPVENGSLINLTKAVAEWASKNLHYCTDYYDTSLLEAFIEKAPLYQNHSVATIEFTEFPEFKFLYYDLWATLITHAQALDLIIYTNINGYETVIYPDGTSFPEPNFVRYIFNEREKIQSAQNQYKNADFDELLKLSKPSSQEQGEIFIEACVKNYAYRNGLDYRLDSSKRYYKETVERLAFNDISVKLFIDFGNQGNHIFGVSFWITKDYADENSKASNFNLSAKKIRTYQPPANLNYEVIARGIPVESKIEEYVVFQPNFDKGQQKTPKEMYQVLCYYLDKVFNVVKQSHDYLDFLDRIYLDNSSNLHHYYWSLIPRELIEAAKKQNHYTIWLAMSHRIWMLETMANFLHPKLPEMLKLLEPEISQNFEGIKKEYSAQRYIGNAKEMESSQDFFDYIMRIYEDGLKGLTYPPLETNN